MAKKGSDCAKIIPESGVYVLELFGPTQNPPKPNKPHRSLTLVSFLIRTAVSGWYYLGVGSIFERPTPNEWKGKWPRNIDFLFVCTGICAGLGNLWRFPSVALQFGGGTFLIAYFTILLFIGFPIFYLEVVLGQFVSRAGARLFDCVPLLRGIGYAQMFLSIIVGTYYSGITAVAGKFFTASFRYTLPWTECLGHDIYCMGVKNLTGVKKSYGKPLLTEVFYRRDIMPTIKKDPTLESLTPNYELIIYLSVCWIAVALIVNRGLRVLSQLGGFLLFAFLSVSLVFVTQVLVLPGGIDGVVHFFKPEWKYFLGTEIWFEALVQVFFSLGFSFGPVAMYSSFNRFSYNMFLDIFIAVLINVLVVLTAGSTFFAVVGNIVATSQLKFENFSGRLNYSTLVLFAEVAGKFDFVPQVTSALIFFLFCLLGIASVSAFAFFIIHMIRDEFLIKKTWKVTLFVCIGMFFASCIYLAPVGEQLVLLLDSYGVTFAIWFLTILELISIAWIYSVKRVCDDIEFMFGFRTRFFWRILWNGLPAIIIIGFLSHLIYSGLLLELPTSGHYSPAIVGYFIGCIFIIIIVFTILVWCIFVLLKQPKQSFLQKLKQASTPDSNWGPADSSLLLNYRYFILKKDNTTT